MQLKELSARTGVTPASIKYYLREGLLQPGESVHATRARYSERHVQRLELIQALRRIVHLNFEQIRTILSLADSGAPRLELLGTVQREVLGLAPQETATGHTGTGSAGTDSAGTDSAGTGSAGTHATDAVVHLMNWPDVPSDARSALEAHLAMMASLAIPVSDELIRAYGTAVDSIAGLDIRLTTDSDDPDHMILTAAVGMHTYSQLLLKLLALAQASHAIRALSRNVGSPTHDPADGDGL